MEKVTRGGGRAAKEVSSKVNRMEFLKRASRKAKLPLADVQKVYDAFLAVGEQIAVSGRTLSLTGVGKFYVQRHKGHPVQYLKPDDEVKDYLVLKFSASNILNEKLREADREKPIEIK